MSSYCSAVNNYIKEQEQFSVELDKDIKVIELFAGVGGFRIGLERASEQFKTVWSSQWEPSTKKQDASEIYVKRFGADGHSNENVCTVGVERIPEADMVVGGFPCLAGDTLVWTSRGHVPLNQVKIGDAVLSHDMTYQKVTNVFDQGIKPVYTLNFDSGSTIVATGNHRFATFGCEWVSVDNIRASKDDCYIYCIDDNGIYYYDKVISVVESGNQHVYDIEVEKNALIRRKSHDYPQLSRLLSGFHAQPLRWYRGKEGCTLVGNLPHPQGQRAQAKLLHLRECGQTAQIPGKAARTRLRDHSSIAGQPRLRCGMACDKRRRLRYAAA